MDIIILHTQYIILLSIIFELSYLWVNFKIFPTRKMKNLIDLIDEIVCHLISHREKDNNIYLYYLFILET